MIAETVCSAVAAAGLGIAAVTAYRKRFLAATRIAAYALVPLGLVMTGVVGLGGRHRLQPHRLGGLRRARRWPGLLFATTRAVERRRGGTRKERRAAARAARTDAVAPAASAPSPRGRPRRARRPGPRPRRRATGGAGRLQRHRGHPQEARHMTRPRRRSGTSRLNRGTAEPDPRNDTVGPRVRGNRSRPETDVTDSGELPLNPCVVDRAGDATCVIIAARCWTRTQSDAAPAAGRAARVPLRPFPATADDLPGGDRVSAAHGRAA